MSTVTVTAPRVLGLVFGIGTISAALSTAQATDTVVVGKETKKTTGTITGLEGGDVACHVALKDDRGAAFHELADFAVCEQRALVGRRVALTYVLGKVMADECGGNPDCKKTRTVALVMSARVLAARPGKALPPPPSKTTAAQTSFCTPMELVVFACPTESKLVSVCASRDASTKQGYLQYRFGKPDSRDPLEIMLPEGEPIPVKAATGEAVPFAGGGGSWLRFKKGDYGYVVYTGIGKWGPKGETMEKQGVVVERGGKSIANLACTGDLTSELGPEWFEKVGVQTNGEDFLFPDPPAPKRR